jgi:serine O-acetyltransferase
MTGAFVTDIRRCAEKYPSPKNLAQLLLDNCGLQALLAYRLGRYLLQVRHRYFLWALWPIGWPVYYLLSRYVRVAFDIRLELSADIGPGLYIGHFGAIHVRRCRMGTNCSIGRLTDISPAGDGPGPVIGDRVWMGLHVHIVGNYRVGSGATVSAGAVVRRDVPEAALCLGNPARLVWRNYDNCRFL